MKYFLLLFMASGSMAVYGQNSGRKPIGEYYLHGGGEMASGFLFHEDHSFDFFFSYGALDRMAKGTWTQHGDTIVLNTPKRPPLDFKLVRSEKRGGDYVVVHVTDAANAFLRNVFTEVKTSDTTYREQSTEEGSLVFPKQAVRQIALMHIFLNERFSIFDFAGTDADYFEFTIEPWIADVDFDNMMLVLKEDGLTGPHPLLGKEQFTYTK
jgi:hypothetical protein